MSLEDFDDFSKTMKSVRKITIIDDVVKCECAHYMKKTIFKQMVGIEIRFKLTVALSEAKTIPIGQKRKRGRTSKAKSALSRK